MVILSSSECEIIRRENKRLMLKALGYEGWLPKRARARLKEYALGGQELDPHVVQQMDPIHIKRIPGLGVKSVNDINEWLRECGLPGWKMPSLP